MKIFFDAEGKVNYDRIGKDTTVEDLLQAVDTFLSLNALPCNTCEDSCCKKSWSVEMDNVCVNRLCDGNREAALTFIQTNLIKKKNYCRDFFQFVLIKDKSCPYITESNRCTIYQSRPAICGLYVCYDKSSRYNILRELVGSTYLKALVLEHRMGTNSFTQRTINKYKRNPALLTRNYDALLDKILEYAQEEGWLDPDEMQLLFETF